MCNNKEVTFTVENTQWNMDLLQECFHAFPQIFIIGDIHGSIDPIENFFQKNLKNIYPNDIMILLGDAGLNYYLNGRDDKFKKKISQYPLTFFIIRGNHEERPSNLMKANPQEWHMDTFLGNSVIVENKYPNIKYALDEPALYKIPSQKGTIFNTLIVPGAYSVDKYYRLRMGWNWFEEEQLSANERDNGKCLLESIDYKCDLVLSHTCPVIYEPTDLFLPTIDQSTVDKSMERYLGEIEYALDYKAWLWGHYHAYRDYPRVDGRRKTMLFKEVIELNQYMTEEVPYLYE